MVVVNEIRNFQQWYFNLAAAVAAPSSTSHVVIIVTITSSGYLPLNLFQVCDRAHFLSGMSINKI